MEELKDELLLYPRGKHDDLLDGLYYATKNCFPPIHQETEIKNKKVVDDTYIDDISWKVA